MVYWTFRSIIIYPLCFLKVDYVDVPQNTQEVAGSENQKHKSKYLVDMNVHQNFQNWKVFAFKILSDGVIQNFVVVIVDALFITVDIE